MLISLLVATAALATPAFSISAIDQAAPAPAAIQAPIGYAACSIIYPAKRRLIHTDPLPTTRSDTDAVAAAFAADMRRRLYTDEPNLEMMGDCHWETSAKKAGEYMDRIKRNITAQGFTTFWMRYTPAVAGAVAK